MDRPGAEGAIDTPNLFALMSRGFDYSIAACRGGMAVSILERTFAAKLLIELAEQAR
jgi:hypothetical protein